MLIKEKIPGNSEHVLLNKDIGYCSAIRIRGNVPHECHTCEVARRRDDGVPQKMPHEEINLTACK